ncbi:MAG: sigma-70 family RNA polymerase sigma factor [Solirubrobacteraceae bacterium]
MSTAFQDIFGSPASRRRRAAAAAPFEVVVERHGPALLRFCASRLGPDRGEDAFQETLLAALRHYDELKHPAAVGGWLFAIAQRKIVDAARHHHHEPALSDDLDERAVVWEGLKLNGGVWTEVAALPAKQREAVGLRFLADLSHADVAQVMGTTVEAARRNVFEGLKRLRMEFADDRDNL